MFNALKSLALFLQKNGTISEASQINYLMKKYADDNVDNLENILDDGDKDFLIRSAVDEYLDDLHKTYSKKDIVGYDNGKPIYMEDIVNIIMKELILA